MRILILRSERRASGGGPKGAYTQEFGGAYAEKVIGNLTGEEGFCTACGPDCIGCRKPYERSFGGSIAGVIPFPRVLPYLLERPGDHIPHEVPPHDILLTINIHEQILIEAIKRCGEWGTRGVVAPLEAPDWVSGSARAEAKDIGRQRGVEIAFPKPFCSFDPPAGSVLAEFRERFHVGKPDVELDVRNEKIEAAHVNVSAACGATYYVARWLVGKGIDEDLKYGVVSKRMHSYPCTASMKWDDELGDTALHVATEAHYEILAGLKKEVREDRGMVMSPLGTMLPRPVPVQENVENVEKAKEAILNALASGSPVSLQSLRHKRHITPAALNSALLLLKQQGKIRAEGSKIIQV